MKKTSDDIKSEIENIIESTVGIFTSNRPPYAELNNVRECAERIFNGCSEEIFTYLTEKRKEEEERVKESKKKTSPEPPVNLPHWWPQ